MALHPVPSPAPLRRLFLFILASLLLRQIHAATSTCYFPDGSVAAEYAPCSNDSNTCCYNLDASHRDLCYDNGFCYSLFFGSVYRGACTDQSWNTQSKCASQCLADTPDGAIVATACKDSTDGDFMCCGEASPDANCCGSSNTFVWNNASIINFPALQDGSVPASAVTSTVTVTTTASPSPSDTLSSSHAECKSHTSALGAGLGVPLAIFILSTLFFGFAFFRTRAQQSSSHQRRRTARFGYGLSKTVPELSEPGEGHQGPPYMIVGTPIAELPLKHPTAELQSNM